MTYRNIVDALCTILEKHKVIKQTDSDSLKKKFVDHNTKIFEDFLLEEGIVTKGQLLDALAELYDYPAIDVTGVFFDHHLVRMFPKDVMMRNCFIPFRHDGDVLIVITHNPNNADLARIIGQFVSYDVTYMVGLPRNIWDAVEEFWDESPLVSEMDMSPLEDEERRQKMQRENKEVQDITEELPDKKNIL